MLVRVPFNQVSNDLTQQNGCHGISWLYSDMIYMYVYIYIIVEHQTWLIPSHDINHALDGYVMGILEHH